MSYSIDEYFDDTIKSKLIEVAKEIENNKDYEKSNYDIFIGFLTELFYDRNYLYREDQMKRDILNKMIDENSLSKKIERLFNILDEECMLKKIEYTENGDLVTVKYGKDLDLE